MKLIINQLSLSRSTGFTVELDKLELNGSEIAIFEGESGCGKSTLLEIIGTILQPTILDQYQIHLDENEVIDIKKYIDQSRKNALSDLRSQYFGFMLQTGGLLSFLTVEENILLPLKMNQLLPLNTCDSERYQRLLKQLGLEALLKKKPSKLSIGQRQRVSFLRSIIHKPKILLADEPTSSLDPKNARSLFNIIMEIAMEENLAAIIVSHDASLVRSFSTQPQYKERFHIYSPVQENSEDKIIFSSQSGEENV